MMRLCVVFLAVLCFTVAVKAVSETSCKKQGGYCTDQDSCNGENEYMVSEPEGICPDNKGCCVSEGHPGGEGKCLARNGYCISTSDPATNCPYRYFDDDDTLCAGGPDRRCCLCCDNDNAP